MTATVSITVPVWDPKVYPRAKWSTSTIDRYADALDGGEQFPAIVLEEGTHRLLDGKHRFEAHKKAGRTEILVEYRAVPDGMSAKLFAASLSARHGDRMSNGDLKALALEEAEADVASFDAQSFAKALGVGKSTVYDWVGHILAREKEERKAKVLRLFMLGWTQKQAAEQLDVSQPTIAGDIKDSESGLSDIARLRADGHGRDEVARRFSLPPVVVEAIGLDGMDDEQRMSKLGIKVQPYDVWQFPSCHDLMGDSHPGRIPGELIAHVLYFFTKAGDLVVDPMVGSGTTLDACLLLGRKCFGFDIDARHDRADVIAHNIATDGWPEQTKKADLVFWDPPYFSKMDNSTIGSDGYIDGSISGLGRDEYLSFFADRLAELHKTAKAGARLAFLMSDWDDNTGKQPGIFVWDYADILRDAGWTLTRHIQAPLSTQQVHPDIVNKFRASRRLARLERYLLVATA